MGSEGKKIPAQAAPLKQLANSNYNALPKNQHQVIKEAASLAERCPTFGDAGARSPKVRSLLPLGGGYKTFYSSLCKPQSDWDLPLIKNRPKPVVEFFPGRVFTPGLAVSGTQMRDVAAMIKIQCSVVIGLIASWCRWGVQNSLSRCRTTPKEDWLPPE